MSCHRDRIELDDRVVIDIGLSVNDQRVIMRTDRTGSKGWRRTQVSMRRQDARRLGVKLLEYVGRIEEAEDSKRCRRDQDRGGRR